MGDQFAIHCPSAIGAFHQTGQKRYLSAVRAGPHISFKQGLRLLKNLPVNDRFMCMKEERLLARTLEQFRTAQPFNAFLNRAIDLVRSERE